MSSTTRTYTFTINQPVVHLNQGEKVFFKFKIDNSTSSNFTASLGSNNSLLISSLAAATGYASVTCPYLDSASISTGSNADEIVFTSGLSTIHGQGYIFSPNPAIPEPNPIPVISSSLYSTYGDVDYPFVIDIFDIILIHLSDGTYVEYRVIDVYKDSVTNLLRVKLDSQLSQFIKDDLVGSSHYFKSFLILSRIQDETNTYVVYTKRPGQTSYGFLIPENLSPDVLANIDTITKEVKQKLINDQGTIIGDLTGGGF